MSEYSETLETLVCKGRTKEAIEQLKSLIETLNKEHLTNLIALSGRYHTNNKVERDGTEEAKTTGMESNRIRFQFLSILSEVREEIEGKINFFKPIPRDTDNHDTLRDFIETGLSRKYEQISHFAEGKSFIYFSAKERHSDQLVMIMVLKTSNVEEIKKNSNLSKISQLKHRNLIQLLDVNFNQYPYYVITEMVSGVDLKRLLESTSTIPLYITKDLLLTIGDVMDYLRQKKFPYSGIRPSRIIIDHEMKPEISPFDIHHVDEKRRLYTTFLEDCYYFAPERLFNSSLNIKGEFLDKANQFCLATLAYEMLTGERLFVGEDASAVLLDREHFFKDAEYRKKRLEHHLLPARMMAILKRMLAFDPNKRYPDMAAALREIAKVRVVLDGNEKVLFESYRRCLSYSDDFAEQFMNLLFSKPEIKAPKPTNAKDRLLFFQRFQIAVHMMFDIENVVASVEKATRLLPLEVNKSNSRVEYKALLDAFTETIKDIDPLWHEREGRVAKAWEAIKMLILDVLDAYLPQETTPDTNKELESIPPLDPTPVSTEEVKDTTKKSDDDVNEELL